MDLRQGVHVDKSFLVNGKSAIGGFVSSFYIALLIPPVLPTL